MSFVRSLSFPIQHSAEELRDAELRPMRFGAAGKPTARLSPHRWRDLRRYFQSERLRLFKNRRWNSADCLPFLSFYFKLPTIHNGLVLGIEQ
jgi:hypothetical protein